MNLTKINIEFKDMRPLSSIQNISANVVLLDRTVQDAEQSLYMLKQGMVFSEQDFEAIKEGNLPYDRDAFILVGQVLSVNKKLKQIILTNQNTVTYQHMIIAAGTKPSLLSYEFLAGVQTLVDALRVRKKIPSSFAPVESTKPHEKKKTLKQNENSSSTTPKVDPDRLKKLLKAQPQKTSSHIAEGNTRLYEVQI